MSTPDLDAIYDAPLPRSRDKVQPTLSEPHIRFIESSPFFVLASSGEGGRTDASPRGDAPGFVRVLDPSRLVFPDRSGNNRLDSLRNIQLHPQVGLLFFVPGVNETLRVNGRASIRTEPELLASISERGKQPRSAVQVDIEEVFHHCPKSLLRAELWGRSGTPPSVGRMSSRPDDAYDLA